jgi:hypothetical protein
MLTFQLAGTARREAFMIGIIIALLIAIYSGIVIYKKYKDVKAGKFCSCGCENCPSKCKEFKKK